MKSRQARKIMRNYFRTGIRPREHTFTKAFNRWKMRGCRYQRPFNLAASLAKAERVGGPAFFPDWQIVAKFLNQAYEFFGNKYVFPFAPIQIKEKP
jgi:hypothetical protein